MKPKIHRSKHAKARGARRTRTHPLETPFDKALSNAFREVEPPGFRDHPRSSLEAAMVDPDVEDSEGGE
ncbi:MAG: hypothetical protein ACHQ49_03595 [Elusimicrobiota bacterium]